MKDWNGKEIACAHSQSGVVVLAHPFDNLISTGCSPWPTPEILQKLHQSAHIDAFSEDQLAICTSGLGYYCDLQSLHSVDALIWSVFGTVARSPRPRLAIWLTELFSLLDLPDVRTDEADIFLWRRIPHHDTLGPGGPEIDVGISTANALILVEAQWQSALRAVQSEKKDKDQIQLRGKFLAKRASRLLPTHSQLAVVGIDLSPDVTGGIELETVACRSATWEGICSLTTHPLAEEVQRYLGWKRGFCNLSRRH